MKTVYLNFKGSQGIETVDEFTREEGQSPIEFRKYVNQMVKEYHLSGCNVYKSSRPTKEWAQKD
jgi:hypothetical protein